MNIDDDKQMIEELAIDEAAYERITKQLPNLSNLCMTFGSDLMKFAPRLEGAKTPQDRMKVLSELLILISKFSQAAESIGEVFA